MAAARPSSLLSCLLLALVGACLFQCAHGVLEESYIVQSKTQTVYGWDIVLVSRATSSLFSDRPLIPRLSLHLYAESSTTLRMKIVDADHQRYEVNGVAAVPSLMAAPAFTLYSVSIAEVGEPFRVTVSRAEDKDVIFDAQGLYFSDQFLELSTSMIDNYSVFGLGERSAPFRHQAGESYTFFASDHGGSPELKPLYGSHPFYLEMRQHASGVRSHGVFFLNSNMLHVNLTDNALTWQSLGGVLDFFFFLGPEPASVVTQYHDVIGRPALIPYWALGYHHCRWGFNNLAEVEAVVTNYSKYDIPLETAWVDVDYMQVWRVFTMDPVNFPEQRMRAFVDELHAKGQHFVVIVDPGVAITTDPYPTLERGLADNIFIQAPDGSGPLVGKVWPGVVYFPDWTMHPNVTRWWTNEIKEFRKHLPVDGLWIDMNEPANFCDGRCRMHVDWEATWDKFSCNCSDVFPTTRWDEPPYLFPDLPSCRVEGRSGADCSTVTLSADMHFSKMYDLHNMYAFYEGMVTRYALEEATGQRPFIITRASFAGAGKHMQHWLGDNWSSWASLRASIPGILNMNMFGIPFVGSDICGFLDESTAELCARWMQVGALYPFSRNHNSVNNRPQAPYDFEATPELDVVSVSRRALATRYQLLPYYYSLLFQSSLVGGSTVRPLFMEFPLQTECWAVQEQFMIGSALLATPVLREGYRNVTGCFPTSADWFDFYTGKRLVHDSVSVTLQAPLSAIPVHVRGGSIVALQDGPATVLRDHRKQPLSLLVVMPLADQSAQGFLVLDDGISLDTMEQGNYLRAAFRAQARATDAGTDRMQYTLHVTGFVEHEWADVEKHANTTVASVRVFGAPKFACAADRHQECRAVSNSGAAVPVQVDSEGVLSVSGVAASVNRPMALEILCACANGEPVVQPVSSSAGAPIVPATGSGPIDTSSSDKNWVLIAGVSAAVLVVLLIGACGVWIYRRKLRASRPILIDDSDDTAAYRVEPSLEDATAIEHGPSNRAV